MKRQESKQDAEVKDDYAKRSRRTSSESEVEVSGKPASPVSSCVSMKSDASMDWQDKFCQGQTSTGKSAEIGRPQSPSPSYISMKSNKSLDRPIKFNQGEKSSGENWPTSAATSQGYTLGDTAGHQEERLCPEHKMPLEVFCKTDQTLSCKLCPTPEHRAHKKSYTTKAKSGKPTSPISSCASMKSDASMDWQDKFCQGQTSTGKSAEIGRPQSPSPSYISMKSNKSLDRPIKFNQGEKSSGENWPTSTTAPQGYTLRDTSGHQEERLCPEHKMPMEVFCKTDQDLICKLCPTLKHRGHEKSYTTKARVLQELDTVCLLEQILHSIDKNEFMNYLCESYPECFESPQEAHDVHEASELVLESFGSEGALKIALKFMLEKGKNLKNEQDYLKSSLQDRLKSKFECIREGNAQQVNPIPLNEIFTELLITEGGSGGVNIEHEVRLIEEASKNKGIRENAIKYNDIFKPLPGQRKRIRTVLTKGIAGIGKTVSVHKFILDWAEGKANQDIHFMFPLPFRDLNLKGNDKYSLIQLLHQYFPELKELQTIRSEEVKTVFIFDGLDECRLPLDFKNNEMCCDPIKKTSVDALLTNLIQGNMLPSALLWITSRPAAVIQIPPDCVDQVTEVRGFNDSEKEDYFRKRFSEPGLAGRIVAHIKSSRSLHIMCHIPVFCWISATVLEKMLDKPDCEEVPKTLTQMYTHFLLIQTQMKNNKYHEVIRDDTHMTELDKEMITKLGNLAFLQLEKGNLIFYEKDLRECGINVSKASEYSTICTEIFKEEFGLYREKVFCFVHLSIQEHLAAVYVQLKFINSHINVLSQDPESNTLKMSDLHKSAVDRALQSENGHFDLFLRFLLGLSLESSQVLLAGMLSKSYVESIEETVNYIKEKIKNGSSAERAINLFHCLNELNYNSLVEEIQSFLRSARHSQTELQPDQCSALAYVLLTSDDVLNEFDLKMYNTSPEGYRRLLPVVRTSRRAILAGVNLTNESCETLASVLQSSNSHLIELDLSSNSLGDLGVKLLCAGLSDPHCKLEKLNLSHNELEDIGVKLLCECLMSPQCKLQTLGLAGTSFSERSCELMASVFESVNSHLEQLDLGCNNMKDSGVKLLSAALKSLHCKLEKLGLDKCDLTHESCEALTAVLQSSNSCLRDLDLSYNKLGDSGMKWLCDGLTHPNCKLEKLDLSYNNLGHSGVKLLCVGLMCPDCRLKSIRLADVGILEGTCETLASVLESANPHLRELDLSNNYMGDSGVKLLCPGLQSPNCKLEKLSLCGCNLTDRCCSNLASVLSALSCLRELELRDNDLQDSGVKQLCAGLQDPQCTLQKLSLSGCCVTEEGCSALGLTLNSIHSELKELDLSYNHPGEKGLRQLATILDDPCCKLEKLNVEFCSEFRNKPGLKKYACEITFDPNTAHRTLSLTGNKKVTKTKGEQPYPDHPDRFEYYGQVLCRESLCGARFYWETEWTKDAVYIGVTYKGINRKGRGTDCKLGMNNKSWILFCSDDGWYVSYNGKETVIPSPSPSKRMGIYLDWQAGTLSFYIISPDRAYHTYTFHTTFTEPLHPGIRVHSYEGTVTLCELK
ncbi:NACHT, LRR and PYD domains-containing protein 12-like [Pygocentrus nattereri]|uniref:NACHT, LRR and PYD domains-containing protein 12-like n=1 Tax=Pygocentrus nattereri TaxID=42514 RepID=UPI001890F82A|nr:NACHT, LRR and PYD domains-containing protein 12-like [Pygocentrus nattereri]XP_037389788.1 NACHT, LRR and PYD domains-containing protein 12-like [Pygocentrus nattereri]